MKTSRQRGAKTAATNGSAPVGPSIENPGDDARLPTEREEDREQQEILGLMRELGGAGSYLRIERRKPNEGEYALLVPRMPLENYADAAKLEDYLMSTYGGGDYRIQGRTAKGTVVKQYPLKIDHSLPAKNPGEVKAEAKAPNAGEIVNSVLQQILPHLNRQTAPAPDNSAVLVAMINSQASTTAAMFTALTNMAKSSKGDGDPVMAAALARLEAQVQQLGQKSSRGSLADVREALELVRELKEEDDPEKKKSMLAELAEGLAPFAKTLFAGGAPALVQSSLDRTTKVVAAPPAFAHDVDTRPATAAAGATAAAPPDPTAAMEFAFNQAMAQFAAKAIWAAKANMNAEDFADVAEQQIPQSYDDKIFALVSAPDWFEKIFGRHGAEAEAHKPWLTELRDIFVRDFDPNAEGEAEAK